MCLAAERRGRKPTTRKKIRTLFVYFEDGVEGVLGDFDAAHGLHALLALFLLLEELALSRDVTAVALGSDVFA